MPLVRISIRHPRWVLLIALLAILAVAPGLTRLQLRTDGQALLPHDAEEVKYDQSIRREFGIKDQIIVLVHTNDGRGIFNIHTLDLVRDLTQRIAGLDGLCLDDVTSLATERGDRVVPGTLDFRAFLEPPPRTPKDLLRIRDDLQEIQLYTGTLVSFDESSTCILVGAPDGADRANLYQSILRIVADLGEIPETVDVVGAPIAESLLGTHILEDLGVRPEWVRPGTVRTLGTQTHTVSASASQAKSPGQSTGNNAVSTDKDAAAVLLDLKRNWIARHIGLLPLAILTMILVFLVTFRSIAAALLPLMEVGACLVFVFSVMGWSHTPIYLTFAVLPVILTAMGIADEIHIFIRYRQRSYETHGTNATAHVEATMLDMWRPVVKTSITTTIGFLSFSLSSLRPVQAFGLFTAIGILFCMFWSLTVVPASLVLLRGRWLIPARRKESRQRRLGLEKCFHRLAEMIMRRPVLTLIGLLVLLALTPWGLGRLFVQDSWIGGFARTSAFYRATQEVNEGFHGTHILVIEADTGGTTLSGVVNSDAVERNRVRLPAGGVDNPAVLIGQWLELSPLEKSSPAQKHPAPISRLALARPALIQAAEIENGQLVVTIPGRSFFLESRRLGGDSIKLRYTISPHRLLNHDVLERLCALEAFIKGRSEYTVGGVLGPCSFLETMNYTAHARRDGFRTIPQESDRILWLWNQYERTRGSYRLHQIIDDHHSRCLLTVFMKNANYRLTEKLLSAIRDYERNNLSDLGISLGFAGDVAVSQAMIGAIVGTQLRSLFLSIAGILIVMSLFARSFHWGLYSVLPCGLAVLSSFATMGALGIPIGVATSMFAAMTLGIGVDFAIHLVDRFRTARLSGRNPDQATIEAIATTGPAILIDALAIALGFGMLILSQVPANAYLGALVVMSVLASFIWTIVLIPALFAVCPPRMH